MSEYQYYEWQRLESPLTMDEQNAVDALSSHIEVSGMQASVSYNWGDFKHDPIRVLAKYFDAYLYFANWGSYDLAFSFPKGLIDAAALEVYFDEEHVNIREVEGKLVLKFEKRDDDGYGGDYSEQSHLSTLSRLRDDIIQGDHRVLYIAWLNAMEEQADWYKEDEDDPDNFYQDPEPPVPAGLNELSLSLRTFMDAFEIDPFLVSAAAERSPRLVPLKKTAFDSAISKLSRPEVDEFLLKIANAELGAVATLRKRLRSFDEPTAKGQSEPHTIGELFKRAEELEEIEKKHVVEERRKNHIARMNKLEKEEPKLWLDVERVLTGGAKASVYDKATEILSKLHELAEYKGEGFRFRTQVKRFAKQYERRPALIERWEKKAGFDPTLIIRRNEMPKSQSIFQIKITLNGSKPPIWRRILISNKTTLAELHEIIQAVMGWWDYHLHQFTIEGDEYGDPSYDDFGNMGIKNEKKYRLKQFVHSEGFKFRYEYDFGDGWLHDLLVEKILPKEKYLDYPVCIKGKGACPPEDVGGVWGYADFLEAIANPEHDEHDSYLEWIGGEFDPAAFDLDEANERLQYPHKDDRLTSRPQVSDEETLVKVADFLNGLDEKQISQIENLAVRRDMVTFLSYLQENRVVGTQATGNLPLKAVREISAQFVNPPILDPKIGNRVFKLRSEDDIWQLFFLHMLAHTGGLITGGQSRIWKPTTDGETFLKTAAPLQLGFMLNVWWHYTDWGIAYPVSGLEQGLPPGFTAITLRQLQKLPIGKEISSDAFADNLINKTGFQWPSQEGDTSKGIRRSAIERMVILPLMEFGCLEAEYSAKKIGRTEIKTIFAIRLTQLGKGLLDTL